MQANFSPNNNTYCGTFSFSYIYIFPEGSLSSLSFLLMILLLPIKENSLALQNYTPSSSEQEKCNPNLSHTCKNKKGKEKNHTCMQCSHIHNH